MARVLYIATRKPLPVTGGRDRMIVQSLRMLATKYEVGLLYFEKDYESVSVACQEMKNGLGIGFVEPLYFPRILEISVNLITRPSKSLQENLFFSRRSAQKIRATIAGFQPDVIVADMIRCGQFVEDVGIPKVLEMDDLLSARYERFARRTSSDDDLLGTFASILPGSIAAAVNCRLKPLVLRHEARKMLRREMAVVGTFDAVTLVSVSEAQKLCAMTGTGNVFPVPPTVDKISEGKCVDVTYPCNLLFLGNLTTNQNLSSIKFIVNEVLTVLDKIGFDYSFDICGIYDFRAERIVGANPRVRLLGYVDSIDEIFKSHDIFLTPITFGSGIKTKILDAMSYGLPVITNDVGIEAIPGVDGKDYIHANHPEEIAKAVTDLYENKELMTSISLRCRELMTRYYLYNNVEKTYLDILAKLHY